MWSRLAVITLTIWVACHVLLVPGGMLANPYGDLLLAVVLCCQVPVWSPNLRRYLAEIQTQR